MLESYTSYTRSRIIVFFSMQTFFPEIFQQQFTIIDFLAYSGGALGLFLGFSVISAVEIIYYFTIRIIAFKFKDRKVRPLINQKPKQRCQLIRDFF